MDTKLCHFCQKPATSQMRCSRCHVAYYCDRTCQKKDWPSHKQFCQLVDEDHQTQMIKEHHRSFKEVVAKYKLDAPEKANEISHLLTGDAQQVGVEEFAKKYDMEVADAHTFLSFIQVGVQFKKDHLDPNAGQLGGGEGK